jgi:glycosyltransferase involved in cell wall biosynthesis
MALDHHVKILMVITTLDTGGAEKHLLDLCRGLIEKGMEIELAYLKGEGSLAPDFEGIGVRTGKIALESPGDIIRAVRTLARRIREGGYAVVHSHLLKADLVSALAAALSAPRALIASKHNDERALLNPLFSFVHGLISERTDAVIVLSDHVGRFIARHGRVGRRKIIPIYYGLDSEAFRARARDNDRVRKDLGLEVGVPVMTMVARFAPQKDHAGLIEAARLLKDEGRPFRLLLVGDDPFGNHRRKAEELCEALHMGDRVTFTGIRRDVPAILSLTDLFVMPSFWEGLGLVFLEAMAFSLPVVASRVSGVPEIVSHGKTGLLVPPGDPEALKSALAELLDDPTLAARLGHAGRQRLESNFTIDRMVVATAGVYEDCLQPDP